MSSPSRSICTQGQESGFGLKLLWLWNLNAKMVHEVNVTYRITASSPFSQSFASLLHFQPSATWLKCWEKYLLAEKGQLQKKI